MSEKIVNRINDPGQENNLFVLLLEQTNIDRKHLNSLTRGAREYYKFRMDHKQNNKVIREILVHSSDFKEFWSLHGPFRYALTSKEFPPVLLEPEEWIFSNTLIDLFKELMQFHRRKMAFVKAPFKIENKDVFKPDSLIPWRISNFCEEWSVMGSDLFTPVGYLTDQVVPVNDSSEKEAVEAGFFAGLEVRMEKMGYILLKPLSSSSKYASIHKYLKEWESDEGDFLL